MASSTSWLSKALTGMLRLFSTFWAFWIKPWIEPWESACGPPGGTAFARVGGLGSEASAAKPGRRLKHVRGFQPER